MTKHKIVQDTGYGLIPKSIMRNKGISIQAKAVYSYLAGFAGTTQRAFPSADLITAELNISRNTFYKYLKELREIGVVEVQKERTENGTFERNVYFLKNQIQPHTKKDDVAKKETPCPKKPDMAKPGTVKPDMVTPDTVNVDTINNNLINNNLISNSIKNNKEENKQQSCKPSSQYKFEEGSIELNLAREMRRIMLEVKPDGIVPGDKVKDLQNWSQHIDYMLRLDSRDPMKLIEIFKWTQKNDFWVANIRSPRKLRDKWDSLELQMDRDRPKNTNNNLKNLAQQYERAVEEEEGGLFG